MKELKEGVKHDEGKLDWTLLPFDALKEVLEVMQIGAKKYSPDNWKKVLPSERYIKAAFRHLIDYTYTSHEDEETGKSHLAHAVCCLIFKMWHDNNQTSKEVVEKALHYSDFERETDLFDEDSQILS